MSWSSASPIESTVQFLNVDVELFGSFDRGVLRDALGDDVIILHEGGGSLDEPFLSFESSSVNPAFPSVVSELIALVNALPEEARVAWSSATRRVFAIGIRAGLGPPSTVWTLSVDMLSALAKIDAEVAITIYGAANPSGAMAGAAP